MMPDHGERYRAASEYLFQERKVSQMNTDVSHSATSSTALPDRAALQARLEETRLAFHTLVESLTDEEWDSKHTSTSWTVRELLSHIVDGLAHTSDAIDHARRGKQFLNLSFVRIIAWSAR